MRCDAPGEEVYKHSDRHSLCNSGLLKQVPTRRFTDSMTSRKTSFFLYLIPSDLQETALVTVAGGRGAPVSSLWPSWVMYLRDKKNVNRRKTWEKGKLTVWDGEFPENIKEEQRLLILWGRIVWLITVLMWGKSRVGLLHVYITHFWKTKRSFTVVYGDDSKIFLTCRYAEMTG